MSRLLDEAIAKKKEKEEQTKLITEISLGDNNQLNSNIAKEISDVLKESKQTEVFYAPDEKIFVEITEYYDKMEERNIVGLTEVNAIRLINFLETKMTFYILTKNGDGYKKVYKSMSENKAKLLMRNDEFKNAFPFLLRFLTYPLLKLDKNKKLILISKGYNPDYQTFIVNDAPSVSFIDVKESKELLIDLISDFCFTTEVDRMMALAYIITPACRGLYSSITARTPAFMIKANRERAGKDYLAGVQGILYEGKNINDNPICTGSDSKQDNDELRKKLTSALLKKRRRIHSNNNKGRIDNAILEQFLTSEKWTDRILGRDSECELNNEVDFSLSANIGITYSPDFWNRCRTINLFYADEDANARKFKRPNLHQYVYENRGKILSAIFSLIKDWVDSDMPIDKDCIFSSFPEWARVVGNIMIHHGFGNPCQTLQDDSIGGDMETAGFKTLFEILHYTQITNLNYSNGFTSSEIMNIIESRQNEGDMLFSGWDFNERKMRTSFGRKIEKYVNRVFSGIVMRIKDPTQNRASRIKYTFTKIENNIEKSESFIKQDDDKNNQKNEESKKCLKVFSKDENISTESGNVVTFGNLLHRGLASKMSDVEGVGNKLPDVTRLPKIGIESEELLREKINEKDVFEFIKNADFEVSYSLIKSKFIESEENELDRLLELMKKKGDIFNPKPDVWKCV